MRRLLLSPKRRAEVLMTLLLTAVGIAFVWLGSRYGIGQISRMGPGFLPVTLGVTIILLSALVFIELYVVSSSQRVTDFTGLRWRAAAATFSALLTFAFLIPRAGLLISVFAAVFVASFAEGPFKPLVALGISLSVAGLTYVIFVLLLNMHFPPMGGF